MGTVGDVVAGAFERCHGECFGEGVVRDCMYLNVKTSGMYYL